jgi:hypothetical protein
MGAAGCKAKVDFETKEVDEERMKNFSTEVETLDSLVAFLHKLTIQ